MYLTNALQIQSNNVSGNKSRRHNVPSTTQGGNNNSSWLPNDVWRKMTDEKRTAHKAKYKKSKASKRDREVQSTNTEVNGNTEVDTETASNTENSSQLNLRFDRVLRIRLDCVDACRA